MYNLLIFRVRFCKYKAALASLVLFRCYLYESCNNKIQKKEQYSKCVVHEKDAKPVWLGSELETWLK